MSKYPKNHPSLSDVRPEIINAYAELKVPDVSMQYVFEEGHYKDLDLLAAVIKKNVEELNQFKVDDITKCANLLKGKFESYWAHLNLHRFNCGIRLDGHDKYCEPYLPSQVDFKVQLVSECAKKLDGAEEKDTAASYFIKDNSFEENYKHAIAKIEWMKEHGFSGYDFIEDRSSNAALTAKIQELTTYNGLPSSAVNENSEQAELTTKIQELTTYNEFPSSAANENSEQKDHSDTYCAKENSEQEAHSEVLEYIAQLFYDMYNYVAGSVNSDTHHAL